MTFCYTAKGQLLRAEYVKEGAPNYEASTEELESKYRQHNEEVVGIPNVEPHVLIEDLINRIRVSHELGNATRLNVTYVIFRYLEQPPQPVFILNVYGIKDTFFKGQDIEGLRKARYVFDADGNLIFFDNVI